MTPLPLLAAVALRAATANCPALADRPPTLVVRPIVTCGPVAAAALPRGWSLTGCFRAPTNTIELDPATPRRLVRSTIAHETAHACAYAEGRADWWEHPPT